MAIPTGIIGLKGTIGGISFYMRKGKPCARIAGGPSKEMIETSDRCQRVRENISEFKGAVAASKFLRRSLNAFAKNFTDWNVSGRLNGVFKKMIAREEGIRGERPVDTLKHKELLIGFNLNKEVNFDSIFSAPITSVNSERNEVTLTIPSFDTHQLLNVPSGATHFRLINAITVLPKFNYNPSEKQYFRADGKSEVYSASNYSDYVAINGNIEKAITLTTTLYDSPVIDQDSALVCCIGITFYQEVNGNMYALSTGNAMKVSNVFQIYNTQTVAFFNYNGVSSANFSKLSLMNQSKLSRDKSDSNHSVVSEQMRKICKHQHKRFYWVIGLLEILLINTQAESLNHYNHKIRFAKLSVDGERLL